MIVLRSMVCVVIFFCSIVDVSAQEDLGLRWSDDGRQCVYKSGDKYFLVDVEERSKSNLCNSWVNWRLGKIHDVAFGSAENEFVIRTANQYFRFNRTSGELKKIDRPESVAMSSRLELPVLKSINGGAATMMRIENQLNYPLQISWVSNNGRPS